MQLIRGTTPTLTINVKNDIDLHTIVNVWVYISQQNKPKVDKGFEDISFNYEQNKMYVTLTQEDTLALKAGDALIQIRALTDGDVALGMIAKKVDIKEVYKGGVIREENTDNG